MRIACRRRLHFSAGHRVLGHEGHCAHLHGHNYVVWLTAEADLLDPVGRIIDFSVLKQRFGDWIDRCWDHGFLVNIKDTAALAALQAFEAYGGEPKSYVLEENPTAEVMARYLLSLGPKLLEGTGVQLTKVVVYETENCCAEASL